MLDRYLLVRVVELVSHRDEPPTRLFNIISLKIIYIYVHIHTHIYVYI